VFGGIDMFGITPYDRRHNNEMANYNPFRDFDDFERRFWGDDSLAAFKTDITDKGKEYVMEADLPGFKKEDINLDIEDNELVIRAERNNEKKENDEEGHMVKCERSYGSFSRSFDMTGINTEGIKATYENGVLKVILPKREETTEKSKQITIE
jgi:HSP20 family protein